eukprot:CAMPEP_0114575318 /NCGR_PEP_ID=MMETSP0125-20121206/200_1 /TAXON_ID=485358 ORGANISM="Aristerostoma sp., Strain ATCC 50986" /NCGR_SAMPLE_ID=MMETSP0125 /ASSEMBLY_ACC=CAM_ASM_000245 /LENGTH=195 /DNA_ID=CAMNT_0001762953 /DNA_START=265 /DNA_END=852 /DNA_ORIENTATION=+
MKIQPAPEGGEGEAKSPQFLRTMTNNYDRSPLKGQTGENSVDIEKKPILGRGATNGSFYTQDKSPKKLRPLISNGDTLKRSSTNVSAFHTDKSPVLKGQRIVNQHDFNLESNHTEHGGVIGQFRSPTNASLLNHSEKSGNMTNLKNRILGETENNETTPIDLQIEDKSPNGKDSMAAEADFFRLPTRLNPGKLNI